MIDLGRALQEGGGQLVCVTGAGVDVGHLLFQKGCWYNCRIAWEDKEGPNREEAGGLAVWWEPLV
jgi:hypothetical protein